jgi:hypothetical protein
MYKDRFRHAREQGYRSGLEVQIANELKALGQEVHYEEYKLKYAQPAKTRIYTPDFVLPNGLFIETKGRLITSDRQKHLLIKEQYPDIDLRFIFSNANQRISKQSSTTYAMWADKNGFKWAHRHIPKEWVHEQRASPKSS